MGAQIPARAEIWFEISALPEAPSQFSFDEYAVHTLLESAGHQCSL